MARRKQNHVSRNAIVTVRIILGYLCVIVIFGTILLMVQSSIEAKRAEYRMGEMVSEKTQLKDEIARLNRQILLMERFERIEVLVGEHLPFLGKPIHPAIEIQVAGLTDYGNRPMSPYDFHQRNVFTRVRDGVEEAQGKVQQWLRTLVE